MAEETDVKMPLLTWDDYVEITKTVETLNEPLKSKMLDVLDDVAFFRAKAENWEFWAKTELAKCEAASRRLNFTSNPEAVPA